MQKMIVNLKIKEDRLNSLMTQLQMKIEQLLIMLFQCLQQAYATNLFGVRYYNVSGHNLINMLVQGSAAYFLKTKQVQVCDYIS